MIFFFYFRVPGLYSISFLQVTGYLYRTCVPYTQRSIFALTRQTQFVHALLSPFLDFLAVSRPFPKQLADGALQCLKLGQ